MGRRPKQNDPWEGYEFIDISPREEGGRPPQTSSRRGRASPPARSRTSRPRGEPQARRTTRTRPVQRNGPPGREPVRRRKPPQNRPRKPLSKGARRFLLVFTLLCMVAVTGFLCVFLLFKVHTIEVTGDQIYDQATVLEVAGYQEGDNLALLTTGDQEEDLETQLPYVQKATISRHFPSTLEIHITAAQKAAAVSSGGQWFVISYQGKILEQLDSPPEGVMQVTGLALVDPAVGQKAQVQGTSPSQGSSQTQTVSQSPESSQSAESTQSSDSSQPQESSQVEESSQVQEEPQSENQNETYQTVFYTILSKLEEWGAAGDFTSLDLTDLYNITMNYQNRVEFQLGSTVGLEKKLQSGYALVTEQLTENDQGTLNLTLVAEVGKAYFTATNQAPGSGASTSSGETGDGDTGGDTSDGDSTDSSSDTGEDTSDSGDESGGEDGSDGDETSSDEGDSTQEDGRGDGIPDTIFTG